MELRHALDEIQNVLAKELGDLRGRAVGAVLEDVVEETGDDGVVVHSEFGQDFCHGEGMRDVGFPGASNLTCMRLLGEEVREPDSVDVRLGMLLPDLVEQFVEGFGLLPGMGDLVGGGHGRRANRAAPRTARRKPAFAVESRFSIIASPTPERRRGSSTKKQALGATFRKTFPALGTSNTW